MRDEETFTRTLHSFYPYVTSARYTSDIIRSSYPMIIKVSTIKQADVLTHEGEKLDKIKEIIYDPRQKRIAAFLTAKKSIASEAKIIAFEHIQNFGQQALLVDSKQSEQSSTQAGTPYTELAKNEAMMLKKATIIDEEAHKYGDIADVFFDTENGRVMGFELSKGAMEDAKSGKQTMQVENIVSVRQDAIIVNPSFPKKEDEQPPQTVQSSVKDTVSSLPGEMLQTFSRTVKKAVDTVKENTHPQQKQSAAPPQQPHQKPLQPPQQPPKPHKPQQSPPTPQQKSQQDMQQQPPQPHPEPNPQPPDQPKTQQDVVREPSKEPDPKKVQDAIGKYVTKNILTPSDEMLAKRGQIITHDLMQNAYSVGVADEILRNVSPTPL